MSVEQVREVIHQALLKPDYRELLFSEPEKALASFDLSEVEVQSLQRLTRSQLQALIGMLVAHRLVPIRLSPRLLAVSDGFVPSPARDDIVIRLGPGWSFGNGTHATTRMCATIIEEYLQPGSEVLDLGTGTGILAIAAAKLGAAIVLGFDVDAEAIENARTNAQLNSVGDRLKFHIGSLEQLLDGLIAKPPTFNFIVMNILTSINIELLHKRLADLLQSGGVLVASGVREGAEKGIMQQALREAGLHVVGVRSLEAWSAIISRKAMDGKIY
jgi:ribosomal protein L11 methyltransferase